MNRNPRQQSEAHLRFIRSLPCTVCQNPIETEAAHVRFSDPRAAKDNPGKGARPDDAFAVPLCSHHHRVQHEMNERKFWVQNRIDPIFIALALWHISGDYERGCLIIAHAGQSL